MDKEVFTLGLYRIIIANLFQIFLLILLQILWWPLFTFYGYIHSVGLCWAKNLNTNSSHYGVQPWDPDSWEVRGK